MPSLQLKRFTTMMFDNCPVLQHWNSAEAFKQFMAYKTKVPVCGAIMLNETWDKVRPCVYIAVYLAHALISVRARQGLEILFWLGFSQGQAE